MFAHFNVIRYTQVHTYMCITLMQKIIQSMQSMPIRSLRSEHEHSHLWVTFHFITTLNHVLNPLKAQLSYVWNCSSRKKSDWNDETCSSISPDWLPPNWPPCLVIVKLNKRCGSDAVGGHILTRLCQNKWKGIQNILQKWLCIIIMMLQFILYCVHTTHVKLIFLSLYSSQILTHMYSHCWSICFVYVW
jgi:hypothetical protein